MPFPFLTPLKPWIVDILNEREKDPNVLSLKMPFAVLTSPALVVKSSVESDSGKRVDQLKKIIRGEDRSSSYRGCVLANNIDISSNYQLNETIIGNDLDGNPIKVEGETNRRISTPIIESIEIDTDGANNTLKTARVQIKCFSLKQLEMFELFFLKPGMSLMLEYGDSSLLRKKNYGKIEDFIVANKLNYDDFVNNFVNYSAPTQAFIAEYSKKVKAAYGSYDYVAGKVTDFSYSIDENSIYNINLEISAGNQFTLAIPHNAGKSSSTTGTPNDGSQKLDVIAQAKEKIIFDFDLDADQFNAILNSPRSDGGKWDNDFFNWGILNEKNKDELISYEPYLSFRFVIKVLLNFISYGFDEFEIPIPKVKVGSSKKEIDMIPVRSHKSIISSSEKILFPTNTIPKFVIKTDKSSTISLDPKNKYDWPINGYNFNLASKEEIYIKTEDGGDKSVSYKNDEYVIGNALNCFILYKEVLQIWKRSFTRLDFIQQILKLINENAYGLFDLHVASESDGKKQTIIDFKLGDPKSEQITQPYRFKPTTINSIVKGFNFEMSLSNLVAGQTVFRTQKLISDAITSGDKDKTFDFNKFLEEKIYKSVDMSQYTSSDGWYTINTVDVKAIENNKDKLETQYKKRQQEQPQESTEQDEVVTGKEAQEKLIKSKLKNFKRSNKKDDIIPLIFNDSQTIKGFLTEEIKNKNSDIRSTLTPIEITVDIDGLSGFNCGEYFNIDGVPETYNRDGAFQITNIKHSLSPEGWTTTLEAGWRVIK